MNNEPIDLSQPKKTISEAQLAANRANALKSTGPRTAAGKLKSASNAMQHGLYSPRTFENFVHDNQLALEIMTNVIDQFKPATPSEHLLTQQLIHMELRLLQMQFLYDQAMISPATVLSQPPPFLTQIIRELNSLPRHIARTLRELRTEQARRFDSIALEAETQNCGIEPIPDQQSLPPTPPYQTTKPTPTKSFITTQEIFDIFQDRFKPEPEDSEQTKPSRPPTPDESF
jgi:hypothetical protein